MSRFPSSVRRRSQYSNEVRVLTRLRTFTTCRSSDQFGKIVDFFFQFHNGVSTKQDPGCHFFHDLPGDDAAPHSKQVQAGASVGPDVRVSSILLALVFRHPVGLVALHAQAHQHLDVLFPCHRITSDPARGRRTAHSLGITSLWFVLSRGKMN